MTPATTSKRLWRLRRAAALVAIGSSVALVAACGWDPSHPFEREAPEVKEAIVHLGDGGDAQAATSLLEDYLSTGVCNNGNIGTPPKVRDRSNGSFDLGLGLFRIGEAFGKKFGDEEIDSGLPNPAIDQQRKDEVDCALRIVRAVGEDPEQPIDLRARARYLEGNLLFLSGQYEDAVRAYDAALELAPGMHDGGPIGARDGGPAYDVDLVGRDAAWNRAIALRRIEDKKDAGKDASPDASNDGGGDGGDKNDNKKNDGKDGGGKNDEKDGGSDGGNDDKKDAGNDAGGKPNDANDDPNSKPKPQPSQSPNEPPPQPRQNQDERMLDQLENAPTVQQESAKQAGKQRRVKVLIDK